mgnify:CR=1 FL=1
MKTLEELNAKLAEAKAKADKLWEQYKYVEAEQSCAVNPVDAAKVSWHKAEQEADKIALAIKLLTEQ